MRMPRVWVVVFANVLLSIPLTIAADSIAHAADCLAAPKAPPPAGSHWYYRVDRANHRKCWYLAPQGQKVRPGASQLASPAPLSTDSPKPPPAATTAAPQQPTVYEIIRDLNAAAPADATLGAVPPAGLVFTPDAAPSPPPRIAEAGASDPPGATDRAPASTIDASANTPAADATEEMPVWPVRVAAEAAAAQVAATAQAPTSDVAAASVSPAYGLALPACALAFAGLVGRAILKVAAGQRDRRQPVAARQMSVPGERRRADFARGQPMSRESFQEFESALERLAGTAGATRGGSERRSHLQAASSR
jgi:hypothetical protein